MRPRTRTPGLVGHAVAPVLSRLPLIIVRTGHIERAACRSALPRERFRCVLGMFSSLEVKVLYPTGWR